MFGSRRTFFLCIPPLIIAAAWIWSARLAEKDKPAISPPVASGRIPSVGHPSPDGEDSTAGSQRNWTAEARAHWEKSAADLPSADWIRDFTGAWFFDEGPAILEQIRAWQPGPFRDACLRMAIAAWASGEPEDALDWLTRFPEADLASLARSEAIRVWTLDNPSTAARWLETAKLTPTEIQIQSHALVSAWMKIDYPGALQWITRETDPTALAILREKAAISTRPEDRQNVAATLMAGTADPWTDPALEILSRSWIIQEPENAEQWLRSKGADDAFLDHIKAGLVHPDDYE